jgi:hypothetical protein
MGRLAVGTFLSLDGVMQGPGAPRRGPRRRVRPGGGVMAQYAVEQEFLAERARGLTAVR